MSTVHRQDISEDVAGKVLRRVEVAKMARKLQDRLALASYKAKNGMDGMSFSVVEAHVENNLKRKRPGSTIIDTLSDTSSSTSEDRSCDSGISSSPVTAPFFSDELSGPTSRDRYGTKSRLQKPFVHPGSPSVSRKRTRAQSMAPPIFEASRLSWKTAHDLPQSSPVHHKYSSRFSTAHGPHISFASETSTVPDSPQFGPASDDEYHLPTHSFQASSSKIRSSPPCTPPPTRSRNLRHRKGSAAGEEGADLLLFLATSPSPANPNQKSRVYAPSTPPPNQQQPPSSMMSTPGGGGGFMHGFNTPGQQFNFADFVNITPSPAQGAFGSRTPGLAKTPLAAKEARRRLNFDALIPPTGSPNTSNVGREAVERETGLGMELGGELIS